MNSERLSLITFFFVLLGLFVFLSLAPPSVYQMTVPCKWMSDKVLFGGRVDYYCYLSFTPESAGTYSYYLYYPGNVTNLKYAKIGIYDVQTPIEYVNISGSLPPEQTERISITIPEGAYDIAIYGEIIGKEVNGDYPDYPYIKGGTYDLTCDIQCKYNKGLIIDKPGTYTLEIFSGYGGNGIDYVISGSYKLPPASLNVTFNDQVLLSILQVNYVTSVDVTDKITKEEGYLVFDISGKPAFRIVFESTMTCSLSGGEWTCEAYHEKGKNETTVLCTREIYASCNFKGILADIPLDLPGPFSSYFADATSAQLEVATMVIDVQPGSSEVLVADLPAGHYYLKLVFTLPYLIPEAKEAVGKCVFDRTSLEIYGNPGETGKTAISIYNIGDENILVRVYPSEEISEYISVSPTQQIIPPKSSKSFLLDIYLPEVTTEVAGYLIVEGCAEEPINIPVKVSTIPVKAWFIEYLPSIIIVGFSALILLILRKYIELHVGKLPSYIIIIVLMLFIVFIFLVLYPIKLGI